jgi:hypothetical protein
MKLLMLALAALALGAPALATAQAAPDPTALLSQIDAQRSIPDMDFELTITSYQADKPLESNGLWGWVKQTPSGNKTLVAFTEPASVKGRKMLMDGPMVYLLFPKTRNPIRLSPLQVLLGQSSNGDVARTGFAQEYEPKSLTSATLDGVSCWLFDLVSQPGHEGSAYRRARVWVEKAGLKPVAADFYGSGDALLKHATYGDWRPVGDKVLSFRLEITDGAAPEKRTVLQYQRVGRQALGDAMFRRDFLEGWTPEAPK